MAKENPEQVGRPARQDTLQLGAGKGGNKTFYVLDEDGRENAKESTK